MNLTANIEATLERATADDFAAGAAWYPKANEIAASFGDLIIGAGVIAALSPNESWGRNMLLATGALATGSITGGTLGNSVSNANRIMAGEHPLEVMGGNKTRAFFANIVNPYGSEVTIDRHAHDLAVGRPYGNKTRKLINRKGGYEMFADAYREVAANAGLAVAELQAITWCVWRGKAD